jgi:hypothetical protein
MFFLVICEPANILAGSAFSVGTCRISRSRSDYIYTAMRKHMSAGGLGMKRVASSSSVACSVYWCAERAVETELH